MREIGPVRLVATDADGRRFPCACHLEPTHWQLVRVRQLERDGHTWAVVTVHIPVPADQVRARQELVNGFDTLQAFIDGELVGAR